jgi:hypothetical protein
MCVIYDFQFYYEYKRLLLDHQSNYPPAVLRENGAHSASTRCRLLELPTEIQLISYGFVFGDRALHIGWESGANDSSNNVWGWAYSV